MIDGFLALGRRGVKKRNTFFWLMEEDIVFSGTVRYTVLVIGAEMGKARLINQGEGIDNLTLRRGGRVCGMRNRQEKIMEDRSYLIAMASLKKNKGIDRM